MLLFIQQIQLYWKYSAWYLRRLSIVAALWNNVTIVRTAQQLQDAVIAGTPHIEIQASALVRALRFLMLVLVGMLGQLFAAGELEAQVVLKRVGIVLPGPRITSRHAHLDLTTLRGVEGTRTLEGDRGSLLGTISTPVESIRGNCQGPRPTAASLRISSDENPLQPIIPGQCVLFADRNFLKVAFGRLWLHSIYVRFKKTSRGPFPQAVLAKGTPSAQIRVWMTSVTLQGSLHVSGGSAERAEKDCDVCGLELWDGAAVYAQDCKFTDFHGDRVAWVAGGSALSLVRSLFAGNNLEDKYVGEAMEDYIPAMLEAQPEGGVATRTSQVRLEDVEFKDNSVNFAQLRSLQLLADNRATIERGIFYSNDQNLTVCSLEGSLGPYDGDNPRPQCMDSGTLLLQNVSDGTFLDTENEWFVLVQEDVQTLPRVVMSSRKSGKVSTGVIAGATIGAVVALLAIVASVLLFLRRRRQLNDRKQEQNSVAGSKTAATARTHRKQNRKEGKHTDVSHDKLKSVSRARLELPLTISRGSSLLPERLWTLPEESTTLCETDPNPSTAHAMSSSTYSGHGGSCLHTSSM